MKKAVNEKPDMLSVYDELWEKLEEERLFCIENNQHFDFDPNTTNILNVYLQEIKSKRGLN